MFASLSAFEVSKDNDVGLCLVGFAMFVHLDDKDAHRGNSFGSTLFL